MSPSPNYRGFVRHAWQRPWLWLSAAILLFLVGSGAAIYSFLDARAVADGRDFTIEAPYAGSHTTNLGVLTAITAEARQVLAEEKRTPQEKAQEEERRKKLQGHIAALAGEVVRTLGAPDTTVPNVDNLDDVTSSAALAALIRDDDLPTWKPKRFGLIGKRQAVNSVGDDSALLWRLESDLRGGDNSRPSFVFVPAPLVIQDLTSTADELDLTPRVKRELVLSKLVELVVLEHESALVEEKVTQAYFIPPSGFARLINFTGPTAAFRGYLLPISLLSDRTYFRAAVAAGDGFHKSEPYPDGTGKGLVESYAQYFRTDLGLEGMIVLDRQVRDFRDSFWRDLTKRRGAPFIDFEMRTHTIGDGLDDLVPDDDVFAKAVKWIEEHPEKAASGIERHEHNGRTAFTVPMGQVETDATSADEAVGAMGDPTAAKDGSDSSESAGKAESAAIAIYSRDPNRVPRGMVQRILFGASLLALAGMAGLASYWFRESTRSGREQEKAEKLTSEIVDHLHGGFAVVSADGAILQANDKLAQLIGVDDPVGRPFRKLFTEETERDMDVHAARADGGGFDVAGTLVSDDGGTSPVILSSAPITYPGQTAARMAVVIPSAELEATIGTKFLHGLSHALKTPAHSIVLLAQAFRRKKNHWNFESNLALLNREIATFSGLIDNVLQISELELKDVEVKRNHVDLVQTLRSLARVTDRRAQEKSLTFHANLAKRLPIQVDLEMVRLVLNNLIDNALKYTDAGSIDLKAYEDFDAVVIEVADTGIGIREEDRDRIFRMFFRSEDPDVKEREGLGIGLHVSLRYVELHGGTLTYRPRNRQPGENASPDELRTATPDENDTRPGSVFVVRLPKVEGRNAA